MSYCFGEEGQAAVVALEQVERTQNEREAARLGIDAVERARILCGLGESGLTSATSSGLTVTTGLAGTLISTRFEAARLKSRSRSEDASGAITSCRALSSVTFIGKVVTCLFWVSRMLVSGTATGVPVPSSTWISALV